jgi:hypothetical protein
LWARRREALLVAILDVVSLNAVDGIEELGVVVTSHYKGREEAVWWVRGKQEAKPKTNGVVCGAAKSQERSSMQLGGDIGCLSAAARRYL